MDNLSETYPPKLLLAIYQKWHKEGHGATPEEEDYINYFKTKKFSNAKLYQGRTNI